MQAMYDSVSRKRALTDLNLTAYERCRVLSNYKRVLKVLDPSVSFTLFRPQPMWCTAQKFLTITVNSRSLHRFGCRRIRLKERVQIFQHTLLTYQGVYLRSEFQSDRSKVGATNASFPALHQILLTDDFAGRRLE